MKKTIILTILLLSGCTQAKLLPLSQDFEIIPCDAINSCPENMTCYSFQDQETPICWQGNPCIRCNTNNCMQLESYPVQIRCE